MEIIDKLATAETLEELEQLIYEWYYFDNDAKLSEEQAYNTLKLMTLLKKYKLLRDNKIKDDELLNKIALELYKTRKYSLGYCANISSLSYAEFMKYLADNKVSILEYTEEEFEDMLNNA